MLHCLLRLWNRRAMLPDLLDYNLLVVFCGTAAGTVSAEKHQYFAGKGNRFWNTLHEVDLTTKRLEPAEYKLLVDYRIGLTGLVKHRTGMDKVLEAANFDDGRGRLREQTVEFKPHCCALMEGRRHSSTLASRRSITVCRPRPSLTRASSWPRRRVARPDVGRMSAPGRRWHRSVSHWPMVVADESGHCYQSQMLATYLHNVSRSSFPVQHVNGKKR